MTTFTGGAAMRVFIVDDSPYVRQRLATVVSELSGAIELIGQAEDAARAVEAIRRLKPDLVILDLKLPGGNGIHVLREIKQDVPTPIVLILTNYPYPQYRKQCHEAGADFFFDKSMDFDKVPELLQQLHSPCQTNPDNNRLRSDTRMSVSPISL
jgi:DNA-binding NarL/FixJ family response regulator